MTGMNYIECDIPEGATLKEWRRAKAEKPKRTFKLPSLRPSLRPRLV